MKMEISSYTKLYEVELFSMIKSEGVEWNCYTADDVAESYKLALQSSITYVAFEDGILCGYIRAIDDNGFYIYICDLLVKKEFRGNQIGRKLMERVCIDYPMQTVYVMSDVDEYYRKQDYRREGSIFEVKRQ